MAASLTTWSCPCGLYPVDGVPGFNLTPNALRSRQSGLEEPTPVTVELTRSLTGLEEGKAVVGRESWVVGKDSLIPQDSRHTTALDAAGLEEGVVAAGELTGKTGQTMPVTVYASPKDVGRAQADEVMGLWKKAVEARKNFVIGLATGSTPKPLLAELVKRLNVLTKEERQAYLNLLYIVAMDDIVDPNLDPVTNVPKGHPHSAFRFFQENLLNPIGMEHRADWAIQHLIVPTVALVRHQVGRVKALGGVQWQLMATDPKEGHVAEIQPGEEFQKPETWKSKVGQPREFTKEFLAHNPWAKGYQGITFMLDHFADMLAQDGVIRFAAFGLPKSQMILRFFTEGQYNPQLPITFLWLPELRPKTQVLLDESAALPLLDKFEDWRKKVGTVQSKANNVKEVCQAAEALEGILRNRLAVVEALLKELKEWAASASTERSDEMRRALEEIASTVGFFRMVEVSIPDSTLKTTLTHEFGNAFNLFSFADLALMDPEDLNIEKFKKYLNYMEEALLRIRALLDELKTLKKIMFFEQAGSDYIPLATSSSIPLPVGHWECMVAGHTVILTPQALGDPSKDPWPSKPDGVAKVSTIVDGKEFSHPWDHQQLNKLPPEAQWQKVVEHHRAVIKLLLGNPRKSPQEPLKGELEKQIGQIVMFGQLPPEKTAGPSAELGTGLEEGAGKDTLPELSVFELAESEDQLPRRSTEVGKTIQVPVNLPSQRTFQQGNVPEEFEKRLGAHLKSHLGNPNLFAFCFEWEQGEGWWKPMDLLKRAFPETEDAARWVCREFLSEVASRAKVKPPLRRVEITRYEFKDPDAPGGKPKKEAETSEEVKLLTLVLKPVFKTATAPTQKSGLEEEVWREVDSKTRIGLNDLLRRGDKEGSWEIYQVTGLPRPYWSLSFHFWLRRYALTLLLGPSEATKIAPPSPTLEDLRDRKNTWFYAPSKAKETVLGKPQGAAAKEQDTQEENKPQPKTPDLDPFDFRGFKIRPFTPRSTYRLKKEHIPLIARSINGWLKKESFRIDRIGILHPDYPTNVPETVAIDLSDNTKIEDAIKRALQELFKPFQTKVKEFEEKQVVLRLADYNLQIDPPDAPARLMVAIVPLESSGLEEAAKVFKQAVAEYEVNALQDPYGPLLGTDEMRQAAASYFTAQWTASLGKQITPDQLFITPGGPGALELLVRIGVDLTQAREDRPAIWVSKALQVRYEKVAKKYLPYDPLKQMEPYQLTQELQAIHRDPSKRLPKLILVDRSDFLKAEEQEWNQLLDFTSQNGVLVVLEESQPTQPKGVSEVPMLMKLLESNPSFKKTTLFLVDFGKRFSVKDYPLGALVSFNEALKLPWQTTVGGSIAAPSRATQHAYTELLKEELKSQVASDALNKLAPIGSLPDKLENASFLKSTWRSRGPDPTLSLSPPFFLEREGKPELFLNLSPDEALKQVIKLHVGAPSVPRPEWARRSVQEALKNGRWKTWAELEAAVIKAMQGYVQRTYGVRYSEEEIATGFYGSKTALQEFLLALEKLQGPVSVLIPEPYYVGYDSSLLTAGIPEDRIERFATVQAQQFIPTIDKIQQELEKARKKNPKGPRVLILTSPGNPTSTVIPPSLLEELDQLLQKEGFEDVHVVLDVAYGQLLFDSEQLQLNGLSNQVLPRVALLMTQSKEILQPGGRLGTLAIANAEIVKQMLKQRVLTADRAAMVAQAVVYGEEHVKEFNAFIEKHVAHLKQNAGRLEKVFFKHAIDFIRPQGAFYLLFNASRFLQLDPKFTPWDLGLTYVEGEAFHAPGWWRFSFAGDAQQVEEAASRLEEWLTSPLAADPSTGLGTGLEEGAGATEVEDKRTGRLKDTGQRRRFGDQEGPVLKPETPEDLGDIEVIELPGGQTITVVNPTGYVVDAGIGFLRAGMNLDTPYLVVAEGIAQTEALLKAGVPAVQIVALVAKQEEKASLMSRGFPGDNIFRADEFPSWEAALKVVWHVAGEWLTILKRVEVAFLRTTARSAQGLLAQLQELLPSAWQTSRPVTQEDVEQALGLYQVGV